MKDRHALTFFINPLVNKGVYLLIVLCVACWGIIGAGIITQKYFWVACALLLVSLGGIGICIYAKPAFWTTLRHNSGWSYLGFSLSCIILREIFCIWYSGDDSVGMSIFLFISLSARIAFAGGLLLLCWGQRRSVVQALIDSLVIALALLVLIWSLHLRPVVQYGLQLDLAQSDHVLAVTVAPLLFLNSLSGIFTLVAACFCLVYVLTDKYARRAAAWVFIGYLCLLSTRLIRALTNTYEGFMGPTSLWILIYGLSATAVVISLVGSLQYEIPEPLAEENSLYARRPWIAVWFPYGCALSVGLWLALLEVRSGAANLLPVVMLMIAVIVRQLLTTRENYQLSGRLYQSNISLERVSGRLRESNVNLEQNVTERTRYLTTLHSITSALNSSLAESSVLKVAMEQTMEVVNADVGVIWLRQQVEFPQNGIFSWNSDAENDWELAYDRGITNSLQEEALFDLTVATVLEDHRMLGGAQNKFEQVFGFSANDVRLLIVPIRSGGVLIGAQALIRSGGQFDYETRALVESVALETGTSLQNVYLYRDAKQRADRDGVTGLYNHRAIQESLGTLLRNSQEANMPFTVLMMDLDNFKYFNDTYGHLAGDSVLRMVAEQLRKICGRKNLVGRYGGDEFIALLPGQDSQQAHKTYLELSSVLAKEHFEVAPGVRIPLNLSYGWASFPKDGQTPLELIGIADSNLYRYKERGEYESPTAPRGIIVGNSTTFNVLDALITAIDNKDHYTRKHSEEVTKYALMTAQELGYSAESLRAVRISGLLHDVGKIAVPDDILRHPGRLNKVDWEIMQGHPSFGAMIVKDLPYQEDVIGGIKHHHERWDGMGYPDKLAETEIPMMGRLLAVPDTYSALTTNRPYRKGFSPEEAIAEISRCIGTQFDPQIARAFIRVMERQLKGDDKKECDEEKEGTQAV